MFIKRFQHRPIVFLSSAFGGVAVVVATGSGLAVVLRASAGLFAKLPEVVFDGTITSWLDFDAVGTVFCNGIASVADDTNKPVVSNEGTI